MNCQVIRARGLQSKAGSKVLPAPWVKVYLVSGKRCLAKAKTSPARRTLDPLFQQQLLFHERYGGCVLQITVWGDYGRSAQFPLIKRHSRTTINILSKY